MSLRWYCSILVSEIENSLLYCSRLGICLNLYRIHLTYVKLSSPLFFLAKSSSFPGRSIDFTLEPWLTKRRQLLRKYPIRINFRKPLLSNKAKSLLWGGILEYWKDLGQMPVFSNVYVEKRNLWGGNGCGNRQTASRDKCTRFKQLFER